MLYTFIVKWR